MAHPLEVKIAALRSRARRVLLAHALAWVVGSLLAVVTVACLLDYLIHFQDIGLRVLCALAVWGVLGYTAWRFLRPAIQAPLGDLAMASRIERRYPQLADQLVSTVEFLKQSEEDPEAGSPLLRRTVVAQTTAALEQVDLQDAIDTRPARQVGWIAAAVALATVGMALADLSGARTALARLAVPWNNVAWPQRNHLVIESPLARVPLGQPMEIRVKDAGGLLPDDVRVEFLYDGQSKPEHELMQILSDAAYLRKEVVTRPFKYRAVGGDDFSMEWQGVEVIDPPEIESLAVTLTYPDYTGFAPGESDRHIRAVEGTKVHLAGRASKPLKSATLRIEGVSDAAAKLATDTHDFTADFTVAKSGTYHFRLEDEEGFQGGADRRYEIRALSDDKPSVNVEQPNNNLDVTPEAVVPLKIVAKDDLALKEVYLSFSKSEEPPRVISLYHGPEKAVGQKPADTGSSNSSANASGGDRRVLTQDWNLAEQQFQPGDRIAFFAVASDYKPQSGQSHTRYLQIVTPEQLLDRLGRRQGMVLEKLDQALRLQTDARRKTALAKAQLDKLGRLGKEGHDDLQGAELTQRQVDAGLHGPQDAVLSLIRDLLAELKNNRLNDPDTVERMTTLARDIEKLSQEDLPAIGREMTSALKNSDGELKSDSQSPGKPGESGNTSSKSEPGKSDAGKSEAGKSDPAKQESENADAGKSPAPSKTPDAGKSPEPGKPSDISNLKSQISNSPDADQPTAPPQPGSPQPGSPQPGSPQPGSSAADVSKSLDKAGQHQDQVISVLESKLKDLAKWDDARRFRTDLGNIQREQANLAESSAKLLPKLLAPKPEERDQVAGELLKNVERQKDLAAQVERLMPRMEQTAQQLAPTDPETSASLNDTLSELRQRAVGGEMRSAARAAENKQLGQAASLQRKVANDLQEALDTLANRRETGLARLVKKLKEAEQQLGQFREKQKQLTREMGAVAKQPDSPAKKAELERLARRQEQLAKDVSRFARQLKRLEAEKAGQTASAAGSKMEKAGSQAGGEQGPDGQPQGGGNAEQAEEEAKAAEKDLADAQQQLAQKRQQAEMDLAFEQLSKIKDALLALKARQEQVVSETARLQEIRRQTGRLTSGQQESVKGLAATQQGLQRETEGLMEKLSAAEVYRLALKGAAGEMQEAAQLLAADKTDEPTQTAEKNALRRFEQLVEALKQEPPEGQEPPMPNEGQGGDQPPSQPKPPGDGIPAMAQIKMLKFLQMEINERTKELDNAKVRTQGLSESQLREYTRLSEQQGMLADLVKNLIKPTEENPEDNPDLIPETKKEDAKKEDKKTEKPEKTEKTELEKILE